MFYIYLIIGSPEGLWRTVEPGWPHRLRRPGRDFRTLRVHMKLTCVIISMRNEKGRSEGGAAGTGKGGWNQDPLRKLSRSPINHQPFPFDYMSGV